MGYQSGTTMHEQRKGVIQISTGSKELDKILGGERLVLRHPCIA